MATIAQLDVVLGLKGQGTFRRNLTAVTAGVTASAVAFDKLIARGGKITPVMRAFTVQVGDQTTALNKLRAATGGLVSDFDLMRQANTAFTLGSAQTVDQFAEMADVAQRLGRALGLDATFALNSLNTGIARQSRLFLDNIGIIISVEDANEAYAASLGKTVAELTDLERREAFRNAAMERARELVSGLGEDVATAADAWAEFKIEVGNALDSLATWIANNDRVKSGIQTLTSLLRGEFKDASEAYIRFLTGQRDIDRTSGPPTTIPSRVAEEMDNLATSAEVVIPKIDAVAFGIMSVNDGQTEFVDRTGEAVDVLDAYAIAAGTAADEVDRLSQAQSAFSSLLGGLGAFGRLFGFAVPGLSQLSAILGISRGASGVKNALEARASGGPVEAGRAYLVGEQGPELMVPSSSGTVVPNGGFSINVNMSPARNRVEAIRDREWMRELQRDVDRLRDNGYSFA